MIIFLETKRLILKRPSLNQLEDLFVLQSDPEVMKYIGSGPRKKEKIIEATESAIKHYNDHGFSMCSIYEKETGEFVGQAGLIYLEYNDNQPDIEVGYRLHKKFWNKGYATEIAIALIKWGFEHLAVDHLIAVINPENIKSKNVLERAGMSVVGKETAYGGQVLKFMILKK